MTRFIYRSLIHYRKENLLVALGVAIGTAVLVGALIIGDSVRFTLEKTLENRLGTTTHLLSTSDRFFKAALADELTRKSDGKLTAVPILSFDGMAVLEGGADRINQIRVHGITSGFSKIGLSDALADLHGNEVLINRKLADRLSLKVGDGFMLRVRKGSTIPVNAPFASKEEGTLSVSVTVKAILNQDNLSGFNLRNSQTPPYNLFLSADRLNELMDFHGKANQLLLIAPEWSSDRIAQLLAQTWSTEDAGLSLRKIELTGEYEIRSDRVFIDPAIAEPFSKEPKARPILTYFANEFLANGHKTPYSFVSTIDDNQLSDNDIIVGEWLAKDLSLTVGDSLTLKYYEIGPLRELAEKNATFRVVSIVANAGQFGDRELMPDLPGMSQAGNCRDWEAGVPIRFDAIRDKDEAYWKEYKGTPKAFISLKRAVSLWGNRFGSLTAIRFPAEGFSKQLFEKHFADGIVPAQLGFVVSELRNSGLGAARNGVDFSQLFLGLSFFLILSALILISLLYRLNLDQRRNQMGTLLTLGFTHKQIRRLWFSEGVVIALVGSLMGVLLAVGYARLVFAALNTLWWDVVRTSSLFLYLEWSTLLTGEVITLLIVMVMIRYSLSASLKQRVVALHGNPSSIKDTDGGYRSFKSVAVGKYRLFASLRHGSFRKLLGWSAGLMGIIGIVLAIWGVINASGGYSVPMFFISGTLLLISSLIYIYLRLIKDREADLGDFSLRLFARRNISRSVGRSMTVIILFAIGTFLVATTGANRQEVLQSSYDRHSGTGGFYFYATSSAPINFKISDPTHRSELGINHDFNIVQLSKLEGDDASCLNLNRVSNPAILGVDLNALKDRFSFEPSGFQWSDLNRTFPDGAIPAVADQTVIQWSLGLKPGDDLKYRNERGDTIRLRLVAGLAPSILQGFVLIGEQSFIANFPGSTASSVFLVEPHRGEEQQVSEELKTVFRDYGWEMSETRQRLMEFNSVTNTYLSIFLVLGGIGLILGTVGLAIVLARTLLERRQEIVLLLALGFTSRQIERMLIREYLLLLIAGVLIGLTTAVVAVLPVLLQPSTASPVVSITVLSLLILLNGLGWIVGLTKRQLKQP